MLTHGQQAMVACLPFRRKLPAHRLIRQAAVEEQELVIANVSLVVVADLQAV
jgi:hypothetical protein